MADILVVGLNPAWQIVFDIPQFRVGGVNRAEESWSAASGKGINAAKTLAKLGNKVSVLQILAGENGKRCLQECEAAGLESLHAWVPGETRECVTVMGFGGEATEMIGPFTVPSGETDDALLVKLDGGPEFDSILFCGSMPLGISPSLPERILGRKPTARIFWDSVVPLPMKHGDRTAWIKVNLGEYTGREWPHRISILVTQGGKPAKVMNSLESDGTYELPELQEIRNPIGAGDVVTAVLADGILRGLPEEKAIRAALSAGMASCLTPLPAKWHKGDARALEEKITRVPA